MKKTLIIALAVVAVLVTAAAVMTMPKEAEPTEPTKPTGPSVLTPQVEENTIGAKQWAEFQQAVTENANATPEEIAAALAESTADLFFGTASPLEENAEFFAGFDNYRITGYRSGAVYMPMIGSIPFIGYVFALEDGTDPAAFLKSLTDNCNPKWNICVEADQVVAGAIGNRVFFLMCPKTMGE
jgi:hypothetical protein